MNFKKSDILTLPTLCKIGAQRDDRPIVHFSSFGEIIVILGHEELCLLVESSNGPPHPQLALTTGCHIFKRG